MLSAAQARRAVAVNAGKITRAASRALRRGGGTALPGVIAERVHPSIARDLSLQLACGSIAVSGTNGKTTTSRFLASILREAGFVPVRNQSGSNLMRGVATSLVERANFFGNLPAGRTIGLFEVDEAALSRVVDTIAPSRLLLLDLFRDQLDRYGEVTTLARLWSGALARLPAHATVVANADDPLVALTVLESGRSAVFFGFDVSASPPRSLEHAGDIKACPRCSGRIAYSAVSLGHLGEYQCSSCGLSRPTLSVQASNIRPESMSGSRFTVNAPDGSAEVALALPGLYNVYNALAAAALAWSLEIPVESSALALGRTSPAFGRMEQMAADGRTVVLALAKNPAGLNEIVRTILGETEPLHLLVMLNDNTADGHDVSWIWDADIEQLRGRVASVVFAGTRAGDIALRFKYGEVAATSNSPTWHVIDDTASAFREALDLTPPGERLFIIPTYTALLDVRDLLTRLGYARPYWED
jgi:UDP-N-acetylmuramyl tripeptide synthase